MFDRSKYYPNATPVRKMILDYEGQIDGLKWSKEQIEHYKLEEKMETEVLEKYVDIVKNTKWYEKETIKKERKRAMDKQKGKVNIIKNHILYYEKQAEECLKNIENLSQLIIEYDGYEKDELLKELRKIRLNNLKVDSGHFTTKPNKFYKYYK